VDTTERKQQGRELEQQGRMAEALDVYRQILEEIDGTPAIWKELPLYVKAGDLNHKLGDGEGAIAMYEQAAKRYAAYGSGKSVVALCRKILRVEPERSIVFPRFARLMIDRGHVGEALIVLESYAELARLSRVQSELAALVDRPEDEVRPVLDVLSEVSERAELAVLKSVRAERESARLVLELEQERKSTELSWGHEERQITWDEGEAGTDEAVEAEGHVDEPRRYSAGDVTDDQDSADQVSERDEESIDRGPKEIATSPHLARPDWEDEESDEDKGPVEEEQPAESPAAPDTAREHALRHTPPRKVLFSEIQPRKRSKVLWIVLLMVVVIAAAAAVAYQMGYIPLGAGILSSRIAA
jgi:tetratricopeptide (TPR) repeat protein